MSGALRRAASYHAPSGRVKAPRRRGGGRLDLADRSLGAVHRARGLLRRLRQLVEGKLLGVRVSGQRVDALDDPLEALQRALERFGDARALPGVRGTPGALRRADHVGHAIDGLLELLV